jgi:hypothetical protein
VFTECGVYRLVSVTIDERQRVAQVFSTYSDHADPIATTCGYPPQIYDAKGELKDLQKQAWIMSLVAI